MATSQQILELRAEIQELTDTEPYTDSFLGALIDSYGPDSAAQRVWISKRNAAAKLVDISESGSSRKMSQLFTNYNAIVASYGSEIGVDDPLEATYAPRTRKAERI